MPKARRPVRDHQRLKRADRGRSATGTHRDESSSLAERRVNTDQIVAILADASRDDFSLHELTQDKAREAWSALLTHLTDALRAGKSIVLRNLGTIEVYTKRPQRYRHPTTGEIGVSDSKPFVRFRPSPVLLAQLQGS